MSVFRSWRWSALAVAFGVTVSTARADMITPYSIPNPPGAVSSASGTLVDQSHLVGSQYLGLGLSFSEGAAISHLNGLSVWVPIVTAHLGISGPPPITDSSVYYGYGWTHPGLFSPGNSVEFFSPGTSNLTTVSSVSVAIVGNQSLSMTAYGVNGSLQITPVIQSLAGGQVWTVTGPGIHSLAIHSTTLNSSPWGVSGIAFTPASTPEPSSLLLAGLGVLGLAARLGWRRVRLVARTLEEERRVVVWFVWLSFADLCTACRDLA